MDIVKENKSLKSKWFRWLKITVATVVGIWAALLVVLQFLLNSSFLTKMAEKYIPEYVDADVHIGKISASMLKSFPNLQLDVENVVVTYPHDRYACYDSVGIDGILRHAGRAESADTLAAIRKTTLSVNYLKALFGRIHIREVSMDKPHFFAHYYGGEDGSGRGSGKRHYSHFIAPDSREQDQYDRTAEDSLY